MAETKPLTLRVPKRHVEPLALLLTATDDQFRAFEEALVDSGPARPINGLVRDASARAGWPPSNQGAAVTGLLMSLATMLESLPNLKVAEFTHAVVQSAQGQGDEQLRGSSEQWSVLEDRLRRLLSPECPLALSAKGSVLVNEHQRLFCEARILTDIRPIFDRRPAAAALSIGHVLKLMFHEGTEETQEFYLAVSSSDLQELKRVIQRAEEKQASLEALVRGTGLPLFSSSSSRAPRSSPPRTTQPPKRTTLKRV